MIRRAAVGAVVLGAGLASTAGVAMATTSGGHGHGSSDGHDGTSCSNTLDLKNLSKGGGLADVAGGAQTAAPINACHIASDNNLLNHNDISLLDGIL